MPTPRDTRSCKYVRGAVTSPDSSGPQVQPRLARLN